MNVQRFAGEDVAMQKMAEIMSQNEARMKAINQETLQGVLNQRARDVRATGVDKPEMFL